MMDIQSIFFADLSDINSHRSGSLSGYDLPGRAKLASSPDYIFTQKIRATQKIFII